MAGKVKLFVLTAVLCSATLSCCAAGSDTLYVSPNPFSAQTVIHFELAGNDTVSLYVYNYVGAKVQTLYENTFLQSGPYSVGFAADSLSMGIYFVSLHINATKTLTAKAIHAPVGIGDAGIITKVPLLFPNPTTGLLSLPFDGIKQVIITGTDGHIVKSMTLPGKTLSIAGLGPGSYVVTILSEKGVVLTIQKIEMTR